MTTKSVMIVYHNCDTDVFEELSSTIKDDLDLFGDEDLADRIQAIVDKYENHFTIDQGGDDDTYEFSIADSFTQLELDSGGLTNIKAFEAELVKEFNV